MFGPPPPVSAGRPGTHAGGWGGRQVAEAVDEVAKKVHHYEYPTMSKQLGDFKMSIAAGAFSDSEIIVMLGENGTGKTTFIRMMAGVLKPDEGIEVPELNVSYKPQMIAPKFEGTVRQLLHSRIPDAYIHPQFVSDVMKPMLMDNVRAGGPGRPCGWPRR